MVEIRCINMKTNVSQLLSYLPMPREGHLETSFHIMVYLKLKHNSQLAFDPSHPDIDHNNVRECGWTDF